VCYDNKALKKGVPPIKKSNTSWIKKEAKTIEERDIFDI
jgi:hypothetical protein